jgi:hypothetical protein
MNGKDERDFPIPHEFRVSRDASTGRWNYTQLAGAIVKGILDYDVVLPQVPLADLFSQSLCEQIHNPQLIVQSLQTCRAVSPEFVFSQCVRIF